MKKVILFVLMCAVVMWGHALPIVNSGSTVPLLNVLTGFNTSEPYQQEVKNIIDASTKDVVMGQVFTLPAIDPADKYELSALYLKSYTAENLSSYTGQFELKIFSGTSGPALQTFVFDVGTASVAKGDWIELDLGGLELDAGGQYSFLAFLTTDDDDHKWGFWKSKANTYGGAGDHGLYGSITDYVSVWNSADPWAGVSHRGDTDDHAFFLTGTDGSGGGGIDSPDIPAGVAALAGNGLASLRWDDNSQPGFDHFIVKRSVVSGGPYTALAGAVPETANYVDATVENGTTYYYVVSARNIEGEESANSAEVSAAPNGSIERPNILMIYLDDLDPTFGCYDGSFGISPDADLTQTPNIDTLASNGMRFTRTYVANPVCSPSHTALLSGNYVTTIGAPHHRSHYIESLPEGHGSLPEALADAGYFTVNVSNGDIRWGASGKTDLNFANDSHSTKSVGDDPHIFQHIHDFTFVGPAASPSCDPSTMFMGGAWTNRLPGQPFFAYLNIETGKAHGFGTGTTWAQANGVAVNSADVTLPPYLEDTADWRGYVATSLNAISCTDFVVGKFLEGLDLGGEADNTIVILASDHGRATMRHKQWLFETGIHVPMIIRWPGEVAAGSVETNLTSIIDVATTCINAAGAVRPPKMEGMDLLHDDLSVRTQVFASRDGVDGIFDRSRAVVGHRFKYIRHFYPELPFINGSYANRVLNPRSMTNSVSLTSEQSYFLGTKVAEELYDLQADPFEVNNLADDPAYATELKTYRKILADWMLSTGDYCPDARLGLGRDLVAYDNVSPVIGTYPALLEDADGDGLSYYHELALDLDPNVPDASNATSYILNASGEIDYTVRNLLDGTRYDIETATNLVDGGWQVYTTLDGETGGSPATTTIPDSLSGSAGKLFIRMAIPQ